MNNDTVSSEAASATLVSVNVGQIRSVPYRGMQVRTGIYKAPVPGPVMVRRLSLEGDQQADLRVHGGVDKAVYLYPAEHYEAWQHELQRDLEFGHFGENLTIRGVTENQVRTGDVLSVGEAVLQVTEPRTPCFKLGIKMSNNQRFLRRFLQSGRSGFYCRVLQEGAVQAGNPIELRSGQASGPTIAEIVRSIGKNG